MAKKKDTISIYNLFYIAINILWEPLQRFYLHVDGAAYTLLYLSVIAVFANVNSYYINRKTFSSAPYICWFLLLLYTAINSLFHGMNVPNIVYQHFGELWRPLIVMSVAIIEYRKDKNKFMWVALISLLLFVTLGLLHSEVRDDGRNLSGDLGNQIPLFAMAMVFVASALFNSKCIKVWMYVLFISLGLYAIMGAATRKAFAGVVIILAGTFLLRSKSKGIVQIIKIAVIAVVSYLGVNYIIENTIIGERFIEKSEDYTFYMLFTSNTQINAFLNNLLGDRAFQYYDCIFNFFPQYPLTGIGLHNYRQVSHSDYVLHSEYMTHLCEGGLIGITLLLLFYAILLRRLLRRRKTSILVVMSIFGLLAILFVNLTAWTFPFTYTMIFYAVMICEATSQNGLSYSYSATSIMQYDGNKEDCTKKINESNI